MTSAVTWMGQDPTMDDWAPRFQKRARREPRLDLARTLWTMTKAPARSMSAEIYITDVGRELRVTVGNDAALVDSLLSRTNDGPLEQRASELRARLDEAGWTSAA
jgi:hypothetical protein